MRPAVWAILVAGGSGQRYATDRSKLLEPIGAKPVFLRSVERLIQAPELKGLILVVHPDWKQAYQACVASLNPSVPLVWVNGGATRRESVWQGLQAIPDDVGVVLVHDAARPLVREDRIRAVLEPVLAGEAVGTSLGVPVPNTIKAVVSESEPWVVETVPRNRLWQVHTPQVFQLDILRNAHKSIPLSEPVTDDADLVERLYSGKTAVRMVMDDPGNLKITTPTDRWVAEAILSQGDTAVCT